jgi:hypothetical protein
MCSYLIHLIISDLQTKQHRNAAQRKLLDDEIIDPAVEAARCASYNFPYNNQTHRRRLFLGTLLADDSFEVLNAVSTEIYNIFHTISFIESNVTHNLSPRNMRFHDENGPNENMYKLYQMYGRDTKVSVDYYSSHMKGGHDLLRDFVQREGNNFRWKMNGMRADDIAIVGDTDETFTRLVIALLVMHITTVHELNRLFKQGLFESSSDL